MGALVGIARAVERGEGALPLSTGVTEVDAVAEQLRAAAALARAREEDAAAGERRARAIGEVAHALNASPDLDTVLRTAVEAVRGARAGRQLADRHRRRPGGSSSGTRRRPRRRWSPASQIERGKGIGGLAWDAGEPIRTDDIRADPRFRETATCPSPMPTAARLVHGGADRDGGDGGGVIYANNFARRPFTAGDEALLVTLAHHAAVAVQKARLLAREHAARAEAEAASRGKDELFAMLGHELRNPLSAIANAVAVLGMPSPPPEIARRAREIIARQNTHLARLVDDLLDVARVTSGKIALERRPVELAQAVRQRHRDARRDRAHRAPPAHGRARSGVGQCGRDALRADRRQPGGQCAPLHAGGGEVEVALRAADGLAVLRVRDSGIGIAPEMLARVFDLFVQGERSVDRGSGGLGLGLTLVRRIAELHGGSVEAQSDGPGRGSEFTVRLPAMAPPTRRRAKSRADGDGAARRILVVEDNADAREMLRIVLELAGHEVHEATDGPSGLATALDVRPDIALVDIGLPGFDGLEIASPGAPRDGRIHSPGRAHRLWSAGRSPAGARGGLRRPPREAGRPARAARRHPRRVLGRARSVGSPAPKEITHMRTQAEKAAAFRALHERPGAFIIPNPWDAGTAKLLASLGFEALATTSLGLSNSLGRPDGAGVVSREEVLDNCRLIAAATDLPVNADLENGYATSPAPRPR